jgi:hypothetical protein
MPEGWGQAGAWLLNPWLAALRAASERRSLSCDPCTIGFGPVPHFAARGVSASF